MITIGMEKPGPLTPRGFINQLKKPSSVKTKRIAIIFTRYPAQSGSVMATARKFRSHGFAILAMKIPSGIANKMEITVTARAINRVRREVAK